MVNRYTPDVWVVVSVTSPAHGNIKKLLSGWYGGFAGADEWRFSSGIVDVKDEGDHWSVVNESGSVYMCHKEAERLSRYTESILVSFKTQIQELNNGSTLSLIDMENFYPLPKVQDSGADQTP